MKLCIDCKHNHSDLWCKSPANGISVVDGKTRFKFASVSRSDSVLGNCGIEAVNFEEKPLGGSTPPAQPSAVAPALRFMRKLIEFSRSSK